MGLKPIAMYIFKAFAFYLSALTLLTQVHRFFLIQVSKVRIL